METNEGYGIINKNELDPEIKASLEEGDLYKVTEAVNKSLEELENIPLNIAVTGETGAGKSTFINAIRGLDDDDDEEAAKTGVVETTIKVTSYSHPDYKNVLFWDLPGVGTPNFKPKEYLEAVKFSQYDFFIIMSSERFRFNNAELAKEIQKMGKKFYFVRTKVDSDLAANKSRKKKTFTEQNILDTIRNDCIQSLQKEGILEPRVFLLSCLELEKYDFNLMEETLEKDLPSNKRHVFLLSLPNNSMSILERKREALKKDIWKLATMSCMVAMIPIPGLSISCNITNLVPALNKYLHAFGLNPDALEKLASKCGKDIAELKSVMKSPLVVQEINKELVLNLLSRNVAVEAKFVEEVLSMIPVIGSLTAGGLSFATTYMMLDNSLKELAEDAVRVILYTEQISFLQPQATDSVDKIISPGELLYSPGRGGEEAVLSGRRQ